MSIPLHAAFDVVFGNVYFVIVVFNIHGRKMRFSESNQNSLSEKSIFGDIWGYFSQRTDFPQGGGGYCLLVNRERSILTKRWAL